MQQILRHQLFPAPPGFRSLALALGMALLTVSGPASAASYTYDALGRVTAVTDDNGLTTAYAYDAAGNRGQVATAATPAAGSVAIIIPHRSPAVAVPLVVNGAYTSVAVAASPVHGTATASGTSITYAPTSGYSGSDSFTYTASNGAAISAPATVSVAVAPKANNVNGFSVAFNSMANAVPLSVAGAYTAAAVASLPAHGSVAVSGTAITYTPTTAYYGADSFTYTASNAVAASPPATASVTVNTPPPIANPVSAAVINGSTNNPIALNITQSVATSVAVATQATHGTASASGVSIAYTPATGYAGPDSFAYTASNGGGTSNAATASITVTPLTATILNPANCPSNSPIYVCASGPTGNYTFVQNTVSITGGSGSYAYQWAETDDGLGTWSTGGTGASFAPSVANVIPQNSSSATYTCTVTDTVSGKQATSNSVAYSYTHTGGG